MYLFGKLRYVLRFNPWFSGRGLRSEHVFLVVLHYQDVSILGLVEEGLEDLYGVQALRISLVSILGLVEEGLEEANFELEYS